MLALDEDRARVLESWPDLEHVLQITQSHAINQIKLKAVRGYIGATTISSSCPTEEAPAKSLIVNKVKPTKYNIYARNLANHIKV